MWDILRILLVGRKEKGNKGVFLIFILGWVGFAFKAIQKVVQPLNCLLFEKFAVHMGCQSSLIINLGRFLLFRMTLFHQSFTLIKVLNSDPTCSFGFFILHFKQARGKVKP